ncbi:DEAD/DEAH box helicase [Aquincola tertiaricarbonis]|uniref:DEAD/DEAH box helicase n=1 Tax=Aquincola tertiaricarbonis TaxID=391953 RepID=UPI000614CB6C|nr:DEAD/DEAH box helicase [Aquincola tertiaricarbonis]
MSFASLGLCPALQEAAALRGYDHPTEIQLRAIPAVLRGEDVLAQARTGSGKTAAFVLPLLQQLLATHRDGPRRLRGLVVVPTRELAMQVAETLHDLSHGLAVRVKTVAAYGGVSINPQMMALRGEADFVVATPGRLLDLVQHNALRLSGLQVLVLDEADRLFDLGFAEELQRLLALLPSRRQNLFFSATFAPPVQALAEALLRQPVRLQVADAPEAVQPAIVQRAIVVDAPRRTQLLRTLIEQGTADGSSRQVLVFAASRYATELVADKLRRAGIDAGALHGELSQGARTQALAAFKSGALRVLVATDVVARGIHVPRLPLVVNFDLPRSVTDYTHRIGRTGRAGLAGTAISFVTPEAEAHFRLIEKRQQMRLPREVVPGFEPGPVAEPPAAPAADPHGGVKGRRKSKKDKLREAAARGG